MRTKVQTAYGLSDTLTLVATETRADSSELPSTQAEVDEFMAMINSFDLNI